MPPWLWAPLPVPLADPVVLCWAGLPLSVPTLPVVRWPLLVPVVALPVVVDPVVVVLDDLSATCWVGVAFGSCALVLVDDPDFNLLSAPVRARTRPVFGDAGVVGTEATGVVGLAGVGSTAGAA
ncbi:hypothetical protein [Mycobacterium sp. OTB74]|uniref:hypothetical protein n=1 Tax=Mycobacterium sp. OTB74 TaxID=1853452 RepID=UPI00247417A1|nr:hypothetical protein [Mycobacterium sp. OTB74]